MRQTREFGKEQEREGSNYAENKSLIFIYSRYIREHEIIQHAVIWSGRTERQMELPLLILYGSALSTEKINL